jgi:hypothetical protein
MRKLVYLHKEYAIKRNEMLTFASTGWILKTLCWAKESDTKSTWFNTDLIMLWDTQYIFKCPLMPWEYFFIYSTFRNLWSNQWPSIAFRILFSCMYVSFNLEKPLHFFLSFMHNINRLEESRLILCRMIHRLNFSGCHC